MQLRRLNHGENVIILYEKNFGFTETSATFLRYDEQTVVETKHKIPIFGTNNREISGLDCFWILEKELKSRDEIQKIQYELIDLQIEILVLSLKSKYDIPIKIKDKEIIKMAIEKSNAMDAIVQKLGFDPRDESWIENNLATNSRERNWFIFERENPGLLINNWKDLSEIFNARYNEAITPEDAKGLHKKRNRFLLGAYHTRMSGNKDNNDWKKAAKEFEEYHRNIENRMLTWSLKHINGFPLVKVIQPIKFMPGPYFHECIEKIPKVFVDPTLTKIRANIVLRVIGYDKETNSIRLDFTEDIRKMIKGNEPQNTRIWVKDELDYDFWILPENVNSHLKFLEPMD